MDNGGFLSKIPFDWLSVPEALSGEGFFDSPWNGTASERSLSINESSK